MGGSASDHVYKSFRADEMERHFNPRAAVADFDTFLAARIRDSAAFRARTRCFANLAYGTGSREVLDIFPADEADAPVMIYTHGGYWRAMSKEDMSIFAEPLLAAGATVVMLEYELCPKVTLTDIVQQIRAGIAWSWRHVAEYGGDPSRLFLSGSSAGGHLVGMALAHNWKNAEGIPNDFIKGAVAITGVMDTYPVLHIAANEQIRLTPATARENNPMLHPPIVPAPLIVAVGADESSGWRQMSRDYYEMCRARGVNCEFHEIPGTHHLSITETIAEAGSTLQRLVLGQMELQSGGVHR